MQEFEANFGIIIGEDSMRIYCMQFRSILVFGWECAIKGNPLVRVKSLSYSKGTLGYMLLILIIIPMLSHVY